MHEKLLSEYWNYSHLGFKIIGCLNKPSSFGKYPVAILHRIDWLKHFTILEVCRLNSQCHIRLSMAKKSIRKLDHLNPKTQHNTTQHNTTKSITILFFKLLKSFTRWIPAVLACRFLSNRRLNSDYFLAGRVILKTGVRVHCRKYGERR
jgi:hypothetical protein